MNNILQQIKEESQDNLVICPVGVGSAFAKKNFNSSFIIAKNGKTLLFDCGATIPYALSQKGIKVTDFDAYHISHAHADHIGGVEELLFMSRYVTKTRPLFLMDSAEISDYWEGTLSGGISKSEIGLNFADFADFINSRILSDDNGWESSTSIFDFELRFFQTLHCPGGFKDYNNAMWSNGISINEKVFISGDSQFNPELIQRFSYCNLLFHDCQLFSPGFVHASYDELKTLPDSIKNKMVLYHYGDNFEDFTPENDGFKGFAKPWEIYQVK